MNYIFVVFAFAVAKEVSTLCLNEAWVLNENGTCVPKPDFFQLSCNPSGIEIKLSTNVVPEAKNVTVGDCSASLDTKSNLWKLSSSLTACGTLLSTDQDGRFSFTNTIRANSFSGNDVIFKSVSVAIDFRCLYDNVYNDIAANDIVVTGKNVETDVQDGEGKFIFTLTQYNDKNLSNKTGSTDETPLGSSMYFQVSMDSPVAGLVYSLIDCHISDKKLNASYPIVTDYCNDRILNVLSSVQTSEQLQTGISLSYPAFQFTSDSSGKESSFLNLRCSVIVCDSENNDSACAEGCNECKSPALNVCGANTLCSNTEENYTCTCNPGYKQATWNAIEQSCVDVNECASDNVCGLNADCINHPGGYTCQCKDGYEKDNWTLSVQNCKNINECASSSTNVCGAHTTCQDTMGSYSCACKTGYQMDTWTSSIKNCKNMNECASSSTNVCGSKTTCKDTIGSYTCTCFSGYKPGTWTDTNKSCIDKDECYEKTDICGSNTACINTPGSYSCVCLDGYEKNTWTSSLQNCKSSCPRTQSAIEGLMLQSITSNCSPNTSAAHCAKLVQTAVSDCMGTPHQCIVAKDTSSTYYSYHRRDGLNYYAKYNDFMALCSKPGARISTNSVKNNCAYAGSKCSRYTTNCVRDLSYHRFSTVNVCNGDKFTFLITTGESAFDGSTETIFNASDGKKMNCVVMCHD